MTKKQFSLEVVDGVRMASDIVLHTNMKPTYLIYKMPDSIKDDVADLTPLVWSEKFIKAFKNKSFNRLIENIITIGCKGAWSEDPKKALMFGQNGTPPDDAPQLISYIHTRKKLCSKNYSSHWVALSLASISRMVAVNASRSFEADEWSEFSLAWFEIEKLFLSGDGKGFSTALVNADKQFFENKMASLIGSRITHALAEISINTYDTDFFS